MATLNFSRSVETDIQIKEDMNFDAIIDIARDDSGAVDFTSKTILLKIWDRDGGTLKETLTSGSEITIATDRLSFDKTFTDLAVRSYYYELYNDTDDVCIMHGKFIVT